MKVFVTVNGREYAVELKEVMGETHLYVDGNRLEVSHNEADDHGQVILMHEGKSYGVSIEGNLGQAHATLAGHAYSVQMEDERERAAGLAAKAALGGGGPVEAVMPGIVVDVLVQEGEVVEAKQPLLILEAMKMQNEILAPAGGVVDSLNVKPGETVSSGAVLVVLRGLDSEAGG